MLISPAPMSGRGLDVPDGLSYLTPEVWRAVQVFGADMDRVAGDPPNDLSNLDFRVV
ncbi:hypothetical protein [Ruegeria arenilitoris]|uniref:hypothetical protein n=1 Tax=Ruegeria arenilitoris TaxID=1173585 RepID=UPI001CFDC289|nr:hypothetical protein [Ruegeria arenilitoris]